MKRTLVTALVLALLAPGAAWAQTSDIGSVQLNVIDLLSVQITNNQTQTLNPSDADFGAGFIDAGDITVETQGNLAHDLTIRANAANWTYSGTAAPSPVKPAGDLEYRLDGSGVAHTPLTTSDQALVSGLAAGAHATDVDLRATIGYDTDPSGTYTLAYTVTVNPAP